MQTVCEALVANNSNATVPCYVAQQFTQCLAISSDWRYEDGGIYFPYAWGGEVPQCPSLQ